MNKATIPAVADLSIVLRRLRAAETAGGVLSVYLDTDPARLAGQGHLIAFRQARDSMRAQIDAAGAERRAGFDAAVERVERVLTDAALGAPGVALFDLDGEVISTMLPIRPVDDLSWGRRPHVEPLEELLDECERVAVLLFDKERTRLFTIFCGQIESRVSFVDEVPGKQQTGDWYALSQKRFERHHDELVLRHVKRTVRALMDELRSHPFDRLVIGGPDEARSVLTHHLPKPLQARLSGMVSLPLFANEKEILTATRELAETIERERERDAVRALIDDATTAHVALGRDATFDALHDGRVHQLFIAVGLDQPGVECVRCGRLTTAYETCPACGGETRAVDVRERAIDNARRQGARIEQVAGDAAALLMEHGGLGARTRY